MLDDEPKKLTNSDLPCPFRSIAAVGSCNCGCGDKEKTAKVYACSLYGRCTLQSTGEVQTVSGYKVRICVVCLNEKALAAIGCREEKKPLESMSADQR